MGIPIEWGFSKLLTRNVIVGIIVILISAVGVLWRQIIVNDTLADKKIEDCNNSRLNEAQIFRLEENKLHRYYDSLYRTDMDKAMSRINQINKSTKSITKRGIKK